ncbi:MAG TPA: nitrous oxide reductase family maturation protein NosD [Ohtaekwangia sp.]|nr:nitrous oxide reductase family maturation protein NosD [Ohtaekwangia sp.]
MKSTSLTSLLVILLITASHARILPIGASERIKTIREGIAIANTGDTLLIHAGVYKEGNIIIDKPLTLLGKSMPVIDGEDKYENISIRAHNVTISGLLIRNTGVSSMHDLAGVGAEDADKVTIIDCKFENTYFAIHISNGRDARIERNKMIAKARTEHQTGNGIHLWKCTRAVIRENEVLKHRDGIYFEFVTHSLIESNICKENRRYGLHFMFSHHDTYKRNTFSANGAGVAVMYTNNVEMYDNRFENNWGGAAYGLLLKDISDSYIEGNIFSRNTVGIMMEGTSRGNFEKNTFTANGWAVKLQANCENNSFTGNNFSGNSFDIVTNGTLVLNAFQRNYWDKYQGYDLNRDGTGDVPFRPVSMYAMVIDKIPESVLLWRSFLVFLLDKTERVVPAVIPENLKDDYPRMNPYDYNRKG